MKSYGSYYLLLLFLSFLFSCQDEEMVERGKGAVEKISASFRLSQHAPGVTPGENYFDEDFVGNVHLVGAATANTSGNVADFQISAFQGKQALFFVANMRELPLNHTEFNTKHFLSEPYIAIKGINPLNLPMVATLQDVECRTSTAGGSATTMLYQKGTPIGAATPISLKRVFARVDCQLINVAYGLEANPGAKLELINVPRYFQLGSPINDYDLWNKADKYLPPIDLTQVCLNTHGEFSLYLPEHYVSHPGFNEVEEGANMTRIRINYGATQEFGIPIGKKEGGFDFGQISRNKVYQIAK